MARFSGKVGYATSAETVPGVWEDVIVERPYYGDVLLNNRRLQDDAERLHSNITVGNRISIAADPYAYANFFKIKYVIWNGVRWTVGEVEVQPPRLILRLEEVYSGPTP